MAGRVAGKVAIVTGAASGLGKADVIRLREEGASVVATDINVEDGTAVAASCGERDEGRREATKQGPASHQTPACHPMTSGRRLGGGGSTITAWTHTSSSPPSKPGSSVH